MREGAGGAGIHPAKPIAPSLERPLSQQENPSLAVDASRKRQRAMIRRGVGACDLSYGKGSIPLCHVITIIVDCGVRTIQSFQHERE